MFSAYIYNEIEKRENNHFTFHFSGVNILAVKRGKGKVQIHKSEFKSEFTLYH